MSRCSRFASAVALVLLVASGVTAQNIALDDAPRPLVSKKPRTQKEIDRRESLFQFVRGLMCEREDRLLEALKAFQEAARLDPEPAAVYKVQIPLLIALERGGDAAEMCAKVVERAPDDCEAWAILARMHKVLGHSAEARQALEKGLKTMSLEDRPELAQQMYFDLGALLEAAEKHGQAADAYRKAADLLDHPDVIAAHAHVGKDTVLQRAAETYERIGDLYRKAKKFEQAADAYRKAQQRSPARAARLSYNLAQLWREQGDDAKALVHVDAYLRSQPLGMDAYEMKIALLRRIDKEATIIPWLEQAAKLDKYNVALHLLLAGECGRAKQTRHAEQLYGALAETSPSPEVYRGLFKLFQDEPPLGMMRAVASLDDALGRATRKGMPEAVAAAQAKAMIGALRDDAELAKGTIASAFKALNKGMPLRFETQQVLAVLAEKHRQLAEAEKFYRGALKNVAPQAETLMYAGLIRVLTKAHKYDAQLDVCDGALNGNAKQGLPKAEATNQVLFLTEKARALAGLRRFDDAVEAADRALLLAGEANKSLVRHLRVRLLTMAGHHADAERECETMLKDAKLPADVLELRYLLSSVFAAAKQVAKAEAQLLLILEADPDNATANNDLGYQWAEQNKNLADAERMIRKAIEVDRRQRMGIAAPALPGEPAPPPPIQPITPVSAISGGPVQDNAAFVDSLGWVLFRRGQIEKARKELERASQLPEGADPVIFDHLGEVYQQLKLPADARRAWEHALELYNRGERPMDSDRCQELRRKIKMLGGGS
jgi:tetratricopeptide (TPR) repeat protein